MKPNFSGEYVLDRPSSVLSPAASGMVSAVLRIDHDDSRFRCSARFASADDAVEFAFERLITDRREGGASGQESSRCYWDGDMLVSEDRIGPDDSRMIMTWRYELLDHARRLRAAERIRGAGRDQDNVWEFDRR
jgi:hypothetical protein